MLNAQTTEISGKGGNLHHPVCAPISARIVSRSNEMKIKRIQPSKLVRCLGLNKPLANKIAKILNKIEVGKNSHTKLIKGMDVSFVEKEERNDFNDYVSSGFLVFQSGISHIFVPINLLTDEIKITNRKHYQVYAHAFFETGNVASVITYVGMTGRNIWIRFAEHKKANSFFGRSFRTILDNRVGYMYHTIIADGLLREEALELEGQIINEYSLYPNGHNIMPGGMEGVEYAKTYGLGDYENASDKLSQIVDSPEELEKLCSKVYSWEPLTDEQLSNMVCNNSLCFSKSEIRFIRICSLSTQVIEDIVLMFKDSFPKYENKSIMERIEKVIVGETYRFVT